MKFNMKWLVFAMLPSISVAALPAIPTGFYLGPSVAMTNNSIYSQMYFDPSETSSTSLYNRNQHGNASQVQPGFILGYELLLKNKWLFSAEFQANFLKAYVNANGNGFTTNTLSTDNQYAVQARLGTALTANNDFIYLLAGISRSEANLKIDFDESLTNTGELGALELGHVNSTHNISGFKIGVGYEHHLNDNLGVRVDYSHANYGTFKTALSDPTLDFLYPNMGTYAVSQSVDMLGLTLLVLA